jgi:HAMP domain-containing protein
MLQNLKLKQKFTIFLIIILIAGISLGGAALSYVLRQNARADVQATGLMLMEVMTSVREYTSTQVNPELVDQLETKFLPQTVPGYSAREVFEGLRKDQDYRDFFYKEATLNPTNLRDKADGFETDIVEQFRKKKDLKEISGFHATPSGDIFYVARPLSISKQSCLQCHSTPEAAPKSMIERYGSNNGFGWQLHEIVGAKMVSVPASKVFNKAYQSSGLILSIVFLMFIGVILLVNALLNQQVIKPLKRITRIADEVSMGNLEMEFEQSSNDEIGNLAKSFGRMQMSLEMAMKRLKRSPDGTKGGTKGDTRG